MRCGKIIRVLVDQDESESWVCKEKLRHRDSHIAISPNDLHSVAVKLSSEEIAYLRGYDDGQRNAKRSAKKAYDQLLLLHQGSD